MPRADPLGRVGPDGDTSITASPGRRARGRTARLPSAPSAEPRRTAVGRTGNLDAVATALVIENDPTDDPRRLGEWLTEAGLELTVLRPHAGDALPADLDGYAALVVLGGDQQRLPGRRTASPARPGSRRSRRCCARRSGTGCRRSASASARSCWRPRTAARSSAAPPARRSARRLVGRRDAADTRSAVPVRAAAARRDPVAPRRDHRTAAWARCCWPPRPATRTRRSGSATGPGACSSTSSATPR